MKFHELPVGAKFAWVFNGSIGKRGCTKIDEATWQGYTYRTYREALREDDPFDVLIEIVVRPECDLTTVLGADEESGEAKA